MRRVPLCGTCHLPLVHSQTPIPQSPWRAVGRRPAHAPPGELQHSSAPARRARRVLCKHAAERARQGRETNGRATRPSAKTYSYNKRQSTTITRSATAWNCWRS